MDFRDLRSFNMAMLGKQILRIIQYHDSILSRIFKAKYFPCCDVLDASFKSNASGTWKSISWAMDFVREGIHWRVGNGRSIDIWKDKCIPSDYGLNPFTPDLAPFGYKSILFFMEDGDGVWDRMVVESLFWELGRC